MIGILEPLAGFNFICYLMLALMLETPPSIQANAFQAVHTLTDICWKKCITGKIASSKLSSGEESCTQNCVERFLDSNMAVLKHLEEMKSSGSV